MGTLFIQNRGEGGWLSLRGRMAFHMGSCCHGYGFGGNRDTLQLQIMVKLRTRTSFPTIIQPTMPSNNIQSVHFYISILKPNSLHFSLQMLFFCKLRSCLVHTNDLWIYFSAHILFIYRKCIIACCIMALNQHLSV